MTDDGVSTRIYWWKMITPVVIILLLCTVGFFVIQSMVGHRHEDRRQTQIEKGAVLPDFTLHEYEGRSMKYSTLDSKVVMVNFWASWCEACILEIPSMIRVRERFKVDGFEIASINVDEDPQSVLPTILPKLGVNFPVFIDKEQVLSELFHLYAIPLTVILDKSRKILLVERGERNWDSNSMHKLIRTWLSISPE